jgi:hypothetical protein
MAAGSNAAPCCLASASQAPSRITNLLVLHTDLVYTADKETK